MATFTRIPETAMAGVMGLAIGAASGAVFSAAFLAIDSLKEKISNIQAELQEGNTESCSTISSLQSTVDNLEKSILGLEQTISTVQGIAATIAIPLTVLQVAVTVLKALPMPQTFLPVSFTVLQSDTMETVMEKIAQINEIVTGITGVTTGFKAVLSPVKSTIQSLKQSLTSLSVSCALGEAEETDTGSGSSKDLSTLVAQLTSIVNSDTKRSSYLVDLKSGIDDIHTALVESLIDNVEAGNYVDIPKDTGDWIATIYTVSDTKPDKPSSVTVPPVGWVENEPVGLSWESTATVSGKSGKILHPWSEPVAHSGSGRTFSENAQYSTTVQKWNYDTIASVEDKTAITGSILHLTGSEEAYNLLMGIVDGLDPNLVSDDLKNNLIEVFSTEEDSQITQDSVKVVSINGISYTLRIEEDTNTYSLAVARRVKAYNTSTGELITVGEKSFTKDNEILFESMKLTLIQMFS